MALLELKNLRIIRVTYPYQFQKDRLGYANEVFTYMSKTQTEGYELIVHELEGGKWVKMPKSEWLPWALRLNTVSIATKTKLKAKFGKK